MKTNEIAIKSSDDPASTLARKNVWTRRLLVVIAAAVLTIGACAFLGMQFGSAEQVILTLLSISIIALLLRVFRSKGRFRFASLLLLTAFSAIVFRVILQPLKRRSDQSSAIELLNRKGGSISTYGGRDRYPTNANGWVLTKSGYVYPALLVHLENKFLSLVEVLGMVIPSSLTNKVTLEALQTPNVSQIRVLLDGAEKATDFKAAIDAKLNFFPEWDNYYYRPLLYVASQLCEKDIQFLNGMASNRTGRELPVIQLGIDCRFEPKLLDGLESGFELTLEGIENDQVFLKRIIRLEKMKRLSLKGWNLSKAALKSISDREQTLESLCVYEANFDSESWQLLCNMSRCHSIRLSQISFNFLPMPSEVLQQLSHNKSIKELIVHLNENQATAVPSLIKMEGLERLEVHCDAQFRSSNWTKELVAAIEQSTLEDVWLNLNPALVDDIKTEAWMDRLKSLRIGSQQFVAPK